MDQAIEAVPQSHKGPHPSPKNSENKSIKQLCKEPGFFSDLPRMRILFYFLHQCFVFFVCVCLCVCMRVHFRSKTYIDHLLWAPKLPRGTQCRSFPKGSSQLGAWNRQKGKQIPDSIECYNRKHTGQQWNTQKGHNYPGGSRDIFLDNMLQS